VTDTPRTPSIRTGAIGAGVGVATQLADPAAAQGILEGTKNGFPARQQLMRALGNGEDLNDALEEYENKRHEKCKMDVARILNSIFVVFFLVCWGCQGDYELEEFNSNFLDTERAIEKAYDYYERGEFLEAINLLEEAEFKLEDLILEYSSYNDVIMPEFSRIRLLALEVVLLQEVNDTSGYKDTLEEYKNAFKDHYKQKETYFISPSDFVKKVFQNRNKSGAAPFE
jgi:tetratricopeptide (TPR) repeat protein